MQPDPPRTRTLQAQIAGVFLLLIASMQIAGYAVVRNAIDRNARHHGREELSIGERVLNQLLEERVSRLTDAAERVANDYPLREAMAIRDPASLISALRRHRERTGAEVAMILGPRGQVLADATSAIGRSAEWATRRILTSTRGEPIAGIEMVGESAIQFVAVPVRSNAPVAWVVLGVRLDGRLLSQVARLTSLEVSLGAKASDSHWRVLNASGDAPLRRARPSLGAGPASSLLWEPATSPDDEWERHVVTLRRDPEPKVAVMLERSIASAAAPFNGLQDTFLVLTLVGLVLSAIGSLLLARRVTRPLRELVSAARRIEDGDYEHGVMVPRGDEVGELGAAIKHMRDAIAARERRISDLAYADPLTGLPNRALFTDRLGQAVSTARRTHGRLAVLTIDLDRFKYVNDTLGHPMGDLLLREVAARLRRALERQTDTVARLGGDEFAVLLPLQTLGGAQVAARKVTEVMSESLTIEGHLIDLGASTGIAVYPEHGEDADSLMRHADIAMYAAKRAGTGHESYDPRQDQNSPGRLSLLGELRQAVEQDQLTLVYQPKVVLSGAPKRAAEALLRWNHPERGLIAPDRFVPFAEQTGYIKVLTRWVLDSAFRQCAEWRDRGLGIGVSVNISARDLHTADFLQSVTELLQRHAVDPARMCLELTESTVMEDPSHALEVLHRLHEIGFQLAIDDFGTGYSSLAYLKRLPVDELKIDKSFVRGLVGEGDDAAIVRATIDLAHVMGLSVTAEGVEDEAVLKALRRLGCDRAQGYFISPPLKSEELEEWFMNARSSRRGSVRLASAGAP
jgi:diguanylate cyclase (GGDEF)-like protein